MQIFNQQLEQAVSKDKLRPSLQYINHTVINGRNMLLATDGHILACIPAHDTEQDEQGLIDPAAYKAGRKPGQNTGYLANNKKDTRSHDGRTFPRPDPDLTYPKTKHVLGDEPKGPADLCLDPALLLRLAKALSDVAGNGKRLVLFHFELNEHGHIDPGKPIKIRPVKGEGYGMIMPCRMTEEENNRSAD